MKRIRVLAVLLTAILLFGCAGKQKTQAIGADDVVLTVGSEPVYAVVYRYHLNDRLRAIEEHGLYERETYLSYVSDPGISYVYAYYDTRTEEGMDALKADVLNELALEAAAIDAGTKAGIVFDVRDQSYIGQAYTDAAEALDDLMKANGGTYDSKDAFFKETGFTEERYTEMFVRNMQASIYYSHLLENYRETHTLSDEAIEEGYARIVKETFADRYTDGMYSKYLLYYMQGYRSFPSLWIRDDAIFVRLFVKTNPTEAQIAELAEQANTDFDALYQSSENELTAQGAVGDLAIAPNDSLVAGLYEAAKDVPIGSVGSMTADENGTPTFYLFLRVEGETGVVPIDRYVGVRDRIVSQLLGAACMDELRAAVNDPAITVRNEDVILAASTIH